MPVTWVRTVSAGTAVTSVPSRWTVPASGSRKRNRTEASVLLPDPLGPTTAIRRPGGTSRSTPSRAHGSPAP